MGTSLSVSRHNPVWQFIELPVPAANMPAEEGGRHSNVGTKGLHSCLLYKGLTNATANLNQDVLNQVRKRKLELLCDDEIQLCARDSQEVVTREEVGNWDMVVGNFTTETLWSKLHFVSDD